MSEAVITYDIPESQLPEHYRFTSWLDSKNRLFVIIDYSGYDKELHRAEMKLCMMDAISESFNWLDFGTFLHLVRLGKLKRANGKEIKPVQRHTNTTQPTNHS